MKIVGLFGLMLLASGCAVFGGDRTAAVYPPSGPTAVATARPVPAATPFKAAYGVGRPIALVPCLRVAALTDDCRAGNDRHQLGGERTASEEAATFTEASSAAIPK